MAEFLKYIDELRDRYPISVTIRYNEYVDWDIDVRMTGIADEYPESARDDNDVILASVDSVDMVYAFAQATVAVKNWMLRFGRE